MPNIHISWSFKFPLLFFGLTLASKAISHIQCQCERWSYQQFQPNYSSAQRFVCPVAPLYLINWISLTLLIYWKPTSTNPLIHTIHSLLHRTTRPDQLLSVASRINRQNQPFKQNVPALWKLKCAKFPLLCTVHALDAALIKLSEPGHSCNSNTCI